MPLEFGLKKSDIQSVGDLFKTYPEIEKAIIYGSRALGTFREGSDVDLTLVGEIEFSKLLKIGNQIDDLLLPYKFDLSIYNKLTNDKLKEHINRVGKIFYKK